MSINKNQQEITDEVFKNELEGYFSGSYTINGTGVTLLIAVLNDGAQFCWIINHDGFSYSAGILMAWNRDLEYWKYSSHNWIIIKYGSGTNN